jgi:hypothetical protein
MTLWFTGILPFCFINMCKQFFAHSVEGKPVEQWHGLEEFEGDCP